MDEVLALAKPFIVAEVKKVIPDADEKVVGQALVALGNLLASIGKGLEGQ